MKSTVLAAAVAFAGLGCVAHAQVAVETQDELRQLQTQVYAQLLDRPDDPQLMLQYAQVSIQLSDYEAAISTLERALIYKPGDPQTLLELGVSYYRIGSYQQAAYYLNEARVAGLEAELDGAAAAYLAEISDRLEPSSLSIRLTSGLVFSSNANLGPDDTEIQFFGLTANLNPSATSEEDVGYRATGAVRHVYDFGGATADKLITDASYYFVRYFDEDQGDIDVLSLTSGPSLALSNSANGPRIRPFARISHARVSSDALYTDIGGGASLTYPVSREFAAFGRLEGKLREFNDTADFDSFILTAELGGAYRLSPAMVVRASLFGEREDAELGSNDNFEIGVRGSFAYNYAPGIEGIDQLWTFSGYARYTHREFDEASVAVNVGIERNDEEFRIGLAHHFRILDNVGFQLDVDFFDRGSNISNFELDNITGGASLVLEF